VLVLCVLMAAHGVMHARSVARLERGAVTWCLRAVLACTSMQGDNNTGKQSPFRDKVGSAQQAAASCRCVTYRHMLIVSCMHGSLAQAGLLVSLLRRVAAVVHSTCTFGACPGECWLNSTHGMPSGAGSVGCAVLPAAASAAPPGLLCAYVCGLDGCLRHAKSG
jgi:hypothetical protein